PPSPLTPARPPSPLTPSRSRLLTREHPRMVGVAGQHPPFLDVRGGQAGDWWPGRVTWVGTTALVTGFEPFGGREENPSMTAVRLLAQQWQRQGQGSARLVTAELPVSYDRSAQVLQELLHRERPDIAIAVGLAAGRTRISIERLAVNLQDATGADNDGVRASGDPVRPEAPVAAWSRLPVKRLAIELSE